MPSGTVTNRLWDRPRSMLPDCDVRNDGVPRRVEATTVAGTWPPTPGVPGSCSWSTAACTPADGLAVTGTVTGSPSGRSTVAGASNVPSSPSHSRACVRTPAGPLRRVTTTS